MELEKVIEPTPYFRPFPEFEDVFGGVAAYHRHLLPLATVDLSHLRSNLTGSIHFVLPTERFICEPGEYTSTHHSYLCRHNWLGFRMDANDKYTFDASLEYFLTESQLVSELKCDDDALSDGLAYYNATRQAYQQIKSRFAESQLLFGRFDNRPMEFAYLGGNQGWPNCAGDGGFPHREEYLYDDAGEITEHNFIPLAEDGSEFEFIGWLHADNYSREIPCQVYLFYNESNRLALQGFDWG